jgi:putative PEP-CTERM system histidine kinase
MMISPPFIPLLNTLLCAGLALFIFLEDRRSFVHRLFSFGMVALAFKEFFIGMAMQTPLPQEMVSWNVWGLTAAGLLPGSWFLFSLSFGRSNYKELLAKWKWFVLASLTLPLSMALFFRGALLVPVLPEEGALVIRLGWSGYLFYLFYLLVSVAILMNLEGTLRASTGNKRWQVKFMLLGIGGLFAVQIYTVSQTLLFSSINWGMESINSLAILVANILIIFSLLRNRFLNVDIYFSRAVLYNSITVVVVGAYLLAVGILAKAIGYFGGNKAIPLGTFFVFIALLGLTAILLSDQLRQELKRFISRNFYQPRYDYRKEWTTFTQQTTSLMNINDLCSAISKTVSETFGAPCVTIWLVDEASNLIYFGGSTVFSDAQILDLKNKGKIWDELLSFINTHPMTFDLDSPKDERLKSLKEADPPYFEKTRISYCVPLISGRTLLGVMTLNHRVTKEPFSVEDADLLKTIADQAAGSLLNLKLTQQLLKAKEMEAFQSLSAFFIHDLKNLASMLSLTMRNLPAHFDNPEFRNDALRVISQSVSKMNDMCSRLSLLTKKLELQCVEVDLNELVASTLGGMNGSVKSSVVQNFQALPKCRVDPDQIQKVIVNLVLNANEAVDQKGVIRIETDRTEECVVLSVSDNGCGIPKQFIERSLFQPFQTTKSQGLGIGLFHTKKIVEAHHGKIEVESEEGVGTTFRVILPVHNVHGTKHKI